MGRDQNPPKGARIFWILCCSSFLYLQCPGNNLIIILVSRKILRELWSNWNNELLFWVGFEPATHCGQRDQTPPKGARIFWILCCSSFLYLQCPGNNLIIILVSRKILRELWSNWNNELLLLVTFEPVTYCMGRDQTQPKGARIFCVLLSSFLLPTNNLIIIFVLRQDLKRNLG